MPIIIKVLILLLVIVLWLMRRRRRLATQLRELEAAANVNPVKRSALETREDVPMSWPASPITIEDCRELLHSTEYFHFKIKIPLNGRLPDLVSWKARHKRTGECVTVVTYSLQGQLLIRDDQDRYHDASDFERVYEPGSWDDSEVTIEDVHRAGAIAAAKAARLTAEQVERKNAAIIRAKLPHIFGGPTKNLF